MLMPLKPATAPAQIPAPSITAMMKNIGKGIYNATAKFAGYKAAYPTTTTTIANRIGTNPNYSTARIQVVGMYWTAEEVAKNNPVAAAYLNARRVYCRPKMFIPNTGDPVLDSELKHYLTETWAQGGINCSMFTAFNRTGNIELPVRGDAGMIRMQDENQIRWMEFSADQVGEPYYFQAPRSTSLACDEYGNLRECAGNDLRYFSGVYYKHRTGINVAFKIYERQNAWYGNAQIFPASDVIFFRDDIFRGIRGVTKFANALQYMQRAEDLMQAGLASAQRQARTALQVFNERGQPDDLAYNDYTQLNGQVEHVQRNFGGPNADYYYTNDKAEFMSPDSPGHELIEGVESAEEKVALALGFTYAFLFSGKNIGGAPSRLDTNRCTKETDRINEDVLLEPLKRISWTTIMDAVGRGIFPPSANITKGHWPFATSPTSDQFRESQQDIQEIRAGLNSAVRVIGKDGSTPQQILEEQESYAFMKYAALDRLNRRLQEAGITSVATIDDIAQNSDNPQQAAAAGAIEQGKPADGKEDSTATMSDFEEGKHPRDDSGKFASGGELGHAAEQKSDIARQQINSPSAHKEASEAHSAASDRYKQQIEELKSNQRLNQTDKKRLSKMYKERAAFHDSLAKHHDSMSKSSDKFWKEMETKE